jgi:branched-chain amino acid transport system ATP-binding protein
VTGEPMLRVEGLVAGYAGAPVLHDIDLDVPAGQIVAVLGANGAGKTTLLRTLSGLVRPRAGRIRLENSDISRSAVEVIARMGMSHVPENGGVIAELTVAENLRLGGLWRKDQRDVAARTADVYRLFPPLAERREAHGQQLSGGERQMLAIGRALIARPRLLLLDEPSLGLAPLIVARIMSTLRHLCDTDGLSVLIVEQNVRAALSVADHGTIISLGRTVARGRADRLLGDDKLRHAYLGF